MNKAEALAKIEEAKANISALESFIESGEKDAELGVVADTFATTSGKTGVLLTFPGAVPDPAMPVTTYLIRAFIARGGKVWNAETAIRGWAKLRWPPDGTPLFSLTGGMETKEDLTHIYKTLPAQPTIGEFLGRTVAKTMLTAQNVGGAGTFWENMEEQRDLPTPVHMLGLFLSLKDPADASTYFSRYRWERVGAIDPDGFVAGLFSAGGDVNLRAADPSSRYDDGRVPASS